ncbi:unnamed protein product [Tenebrio molitor]|nr:unnamed protein product [Tenebrio molitor]
MTAEQVSQVLKDARNPLFFAPPNRRRVPVGRSPAGGNWNCQRRPVGESEEGGRRKILKKDESSMVNPRVPTQYYYALRLREQMTKRAAAH